MKTGVEHWRCAVVQLLLEAAQPVQVIGARWQEGIDGDFQVRQSRLWPTLIQVAQIVQARVMERDCQWPVVGPMHLARQRPLQSHQIARREAPRHDKGQAVHLGAQWLKTLQIDARSGEARLPLAQLVRPQAFGLCRQV